MASATAILKQMFSDQVAGLAAKRDIIFTKRFCLGKHICLLEFMADLQTYRFEPQRVPNPEDSERENEEVNHWSEGTFWCSCERCQIITTQRECVCC